MKTLILSIATVIITTGVYAQAKSTYRKENKSEYKYYSGSENRSPPDGFMFNNGEFLMMKNGKMTFVKNDTTLSDGTIIMSDGYYKKKDGSKIMFKEGEHMDMSGKITPINSSEYTHGSDNKNYPNGYIFQNGKVMKIKNGNITPLEVDIQLIDGTSIMKNGYYQMEGEEKMKFKEGEHIDMSGQLTQTNDAKNNDEYNRQQNKSYQLPDSTKNDDY